MWATYWFGGVWVLSPEFICLECGALFDEPEKYIERHGFDTPPYEETSGCPFCGGTYTHTILCEACGEPITGDYVKIGRTGNCYCDLCYTLMSIGD